MQAAEDEDRRQDVFDKLKQCTDQKLLRGGTERAIEIAKTAVELAGRSPALPAPWPQLAAYRLAHLKMRSRDLNKDALREIDRLFAEAAGEQALGPLPTIYHLAVLSRLERTLKKRESRASIRKRIQELFRNAIDQLSRSTSDAEQASGQKVVLQNAAFNLLELASYFLDVEYSPLEGKAGLDQLDPLRKGDWYLIGRGIHKIAMTEALARCEFQARSETGDYLLIEMTERSTKARRKANNSNHHACTAKWRMSNSSSDQWQAANRDQSLLIIRSIEQPNLSISQLQQQVTGSDNSENFRKIKQRTQTQIQKVTQLKQLEVFPNNRLTDQIAFLALVQGSTMRPKRSF